MKRLPYPGDGVAANNGSTSRPAGASVCVAQDGMKVQVTNAGNDSERLPPMLDQLKERYERVPDTALSMVASRRSRQSMRPQKAAVTVRAGQRQEEARGGRKRTLCRKKGTAMRRPHGGSDGNQEAKSPALRQLVSHRRQSLQAVEMPGGAVGSVRALRISLRLRLTPRLSITIRVRHRHDHV